MQGNNSRSAGRGGLLGVAGFPRGVNQKVALLFAINLLSVLLVGGVSIVFARSIYIAAEKIRQEQREVQIADRIHTAFHHFLSTLHRAVILSRPIPGSIRSGYREEFRQLLAHEHGYHRESPEQRFVDRLKQANSQLFALSERLGTAQANGGSTPRHGRLFDELDDLAADIQLLTHSLSIAHQARMDRLLEGNKSSMQWIFALYAVFFVLGTALIAVSGIYFERTIARPLRQLAAVAAEVAGGKRPEKTPVMSRDEMGLLTHSLNVMIERLAENEGRLKKLAILEERERIAGELHDAPAQSLAFLGLKLNELETGLAKVRPGYMDTSVIEMRKLIQTAYDEVREAIFALRVEASEAGGFVPTLAAFIRDYSAMRKIAIDLRIPDPLALRLAPHAEVQLARIIQEALTNVAKHAHANKSVVSIECRESFATAIVEDDGKGFMLDAAGSSGLHFGLNTMRERAQAVGGECAIDSAPGKGTRIIVRLPLERNNRDEAHTGAVG